MRDCSSDTAPRHTTSDGVVLQGDALSAYYRTNLHRGTLPVAGYFCIQCGHELVDPQSACSECYTRAR